MKTVRRFMYFIMRLFGSVPDNGAEQAYERKNFEWRTMYIRYRQDEIERRMQIRESFNQFNEELEEKIKRHHDQYYNRNK